MSKSITCIAPTPYEALVGVTKVFPSADNLRGDGGQEEGDGGE